jgi:hypothetical protein
LYDLLKNKQTEINEVLSETKKIQSQITYIDSNLAMKDAPSDTDIETDRILRRQAAEVMMLWEVQQQYKMCATNTSDVPGFSQNPKLVNLLDMLSDRFVALAQQHSELSLDLGNPGAQANETAIRNRMEVLKGAMLM